MPAKAIPEGFERITAHLSVQGAAAAIDFYKKAFGAEEICRMPSPDGSSIMHAEIRIGQSMVMLADENPQSPHWCSPKKLKGTTVGMMMYVENVDAAFNKAISAGATPVVPPTDMFWGDRYSAVTDPFGHQWEIATHKQDLTPEQIAANAASFFANAPGCGG